MTNEQIERQNILNSRRVLASNVHHNYTRMCNGASMESVASGDNTANSFSARLQEQERAFRDKHGYSA